MLSDVILNWKCTHNSHFNLHWKATDLTTQNSGQFFGFCRCFILLLSSSFLLQLFKTKSPKIASWPGILVCHKETRIKVVLARKLGKQGHGSSPVLFQYIHWPVPRGRGTGRFPPARHWSVNVIKQDNHQSPYFQLEIPFGSTKISGINKVYTFIWNDFWTLRNFWRSSIQFLIPRIIVRISLIFSCWTIGNDCLFSRSRSIYFHLEKCDWKKYSVASNKSDSRELT